MSRKSNDTLKYPSKDGNVYNDYYDARSADKKWEQQQNILNELKRQNDISEKQLQQQNNYTEHKDIYTLKGRSYPLTSIGKYHSCDGNNYDTIEEAQQHNREYWNQVCGGTSGTDKSADKLCAICWIITFLIIGGMVGLFALFPLLVK